MPRIPPPKFPKRPRQSFLVNDASQLFRKLSAEVNLFLNSQFDTMRSGHLALNIAMTAWHMNDWVYADMDEHQREVAASFLGARVASYKDFVSATTAYCEDLRMCQVIATASKHVEVESRPDPSLHTRFEIVDVGVDEARPQLFTIWIIKSGGSKHPAQEVFKRVHRFWEDMLSNLGMMEDPIMGGLERGW